jgi:hypothetical protein
MAGKKLTEEEKFKFFQEVVKFERNPETRRRYIRQWSEGRIRVYKKRGRVCLDSPADKVMILDGRAGFEFVSYDDPRLRPMSEKEKQELDGMIEELEELEKKFDEKKGEAKVVSLDVQRDKRSNIPRRSR